MDIHDLRCALVALDTGSFAQAATEVHVTRQALSQTVRRLEDELAVRLFEVADGNRLVTTPEGAVFLAQARPVVEAFDELARAYPSMRTGVVGELSVALATGVVLSLPGGFFSHFTESDPSLVLEYEEGNTESSLELLESGRADVALVGSCPSMLPEAKFERALLVATGLWLAVPCTNALACKERLIPADLEGQRIVTAGKSNHLHRYIMELCKAQGVHVEIPATSSNPDMLVKLAAEHDALCFAFPERLTPPGRKSASERGVVLPLDTPESSLFGTYAVRRRDSRRTPAARRFWAYACECAEAPRI